MRVVDLELLLLLLAMLVVLAIGRGARAVGVFPPSRRERVNAFAYYVALPALVFASTYDQPIGEVLTARLLGGIAVVIGTTAALSWLVHRTVPTAATRSVATSQSYHSNLGYLGLPVVAMTFGSVTTARASIVLGIGSLLQLLLTVTVLSTMNGSDVPLRRELAGVATNPIILTVALGLSASAIGLSLPSAPAAGIDLLGDAALPLALLVVGGALTLEASSIDYGTVGVVVATKLLVMPAIALLVFVLAGAEVETVRAGVVMFAMPTAVSTFVFASELGGDRDLASVNVVATTVGSVASLLVVVRLLETLT